MFINALGLNWGQFWPQEIWISGNHVGVYLGGTTGIPWVETFYNRQDVSPTTTNYLAQNINSAKVENHEFILRIIQRPGQDLWWEKGRMQWASPLHPASSSKSWTYPSNIRKDVQDRHTSLHKAELRDPPTWYKTLPYEDPIC